MKCSGVLLTTQFSDSKGLGTDNVILCVSHLTEYIGEGLGGEDC